MSSRIRPSVGIPCAHDTVAPRKIVSVLALHGAEDVLKFGSTDFIQDPARVFSALVDVVYTGISILPAGSGPLYTNTPLRTPDFFIARCSAPS